MRNKRSNIKVGKDTVAESGQYPFLHSDPKIFQFHSSYAFSIYSYISMLEQKPQILRGVALMSRGGLHILYIDLDFNIEYAANSVYDKNK